MKPFAHHLACAAVAMAATVLAGAGCKSTSTAAPPSTFGVNITVNAKALSSAQLGMASVGSLVVTGAEPRTKTFSVTPQITSGQLTFQYLPTVTSGMLTFAFEALDASGNLLGSGTSAAVTLEAGLAVPATITLTAAPGTAKGVGTNCTADAQCASGFCTDGVCCQEACKDTCASCALENTKGLCTAYAVGSDPEKECVGFTMADSSGGSGGHGGAAGQGGEAGAGGGRADAGTTVDASTTDAETINAPDGGIVETASKCGGMCSGMRSCAFDKAGTSCGSVFCNTHKDLASPICDGKGSCGLTLTDCTGGYACDATGKPVACRSTCSANTDCLAGYYCNGTNNMCAGTKADGLTCQTDAECTSSHCASGVCCNTACDSPNTCNNQGSAGKCQCPGVTCAAGVACQIFYADTDVDGYGDRNGTLAAGTAKAGCAGSPPTGFVADNTDCDDKDANVHPGQTTYFASVSKGTGTFDYDCDGTIEKGTPEYLGASCTFCPSCQSGCATGATTCSTSGAQSSLVCPLEGTICPILVQPTQTLMSVAPVTEAATGPPIVIKTACCGCNTADHAGFTTTVSCGASANTYVTCGTCSAVGAGSSSTVGSRQQTCR
jgi:hypothetical protein